MRCALTTFKCCDNVFRRGQKNRIKLALLFFLSFHLCWHLVQDNPKDCGFERQDTRSDDSTMYESCSNETNKPVVGCTVNNKKILYKEDVRVLGTGLQNKVFLTLGIPTIQRSFNNKTLSYLEATLNSLIENLSPEQLSEVHIVVFLADFDENAREKKLQTISKTYQKYIDSNLINVIQAPREYYPKLRGLPRTWGDPEKQVFWRSKQNIDYAFLFSYCEDLSEYYMQMEDDVTTVKGYLTTIKNCLKKYEKIRWVFIPTVYWGFVGKLFKNVEVDYFSRALRMFYNELPCDWLIGSFNHWRGDNSSILNRGCGNIFFHKGKQSSLKNVLQSM